MFRLALSRTLYFAFADASTRPRVIILSHSNPNAHFAFLQTDLSAINSRFNAVTLQVGSAALRAFVEGLNEKRHIIRKVQRNNYGYKDLQAILLKEKGYNEAMNEHAEDILQLKHSFTTLCEEVSNVVNGKNLLLWLQICCRLEIIECKVWSKLLSVVITCFSELSQKQQATVIGFVHTYLRGKFISFTFSPSKFIYRENYLVDLTNFRELIKLFLAALTQAEPSQVLLTLQRVIDIVEKTSKIYVINFNEISQGYRKNSVQFEKMIEKGSLELQAEYLRFLSIIGHYDLKAFASIEKAIKVKWREMKEKRISNAEQSRLISRILYFWANSNHFDKQMFEEFIKPFIVSQLQEGVKDRQHSIWLFHLAICNIEPLLLTQWLVKIGRNLAMSNKYLHIVSHYLHIQSGTKGYCSYLCSQNPTTIDIVKNNGKAYLNCMEREQSGQEQQVDKGLVFMSKISAQENPPQQFWLKMTKRAFLELQHEYPHPSNAIYFNFEMCVFQIDAMVILGGKAIAVQLGGSHYNLRDDSSPPNTQKQGKKLIKERILASYGVRFLELTSTNALQRNLNSFGDQAGATLFLRAKLRELLT